MVLNVGGCLDGGWRVAGWWQQDGWKVEDQPRRGREDAMNEEEEGEEKVTLLLVITSLTFVDKFGLFYPLKKWLCANDN